MNYKTLPEKQSHALRRDFINKFADKTLPQYRQVMGHGDTYGNNTHNGCLWEVIRPYTLISFELALSLVSKMDEAFVTWDFSDVKYDKSMFKTPVMKVSGEELSNQLKITPKGLPENLYIFDSELSYYITFTNQNIKGVGRVCMTSISDLRETGITRMMEELISSSCFGDGVYI